MPNHEWRVLPLLRLLEDSVGEWVFIAMHVPLFAVLIGLIASLDKRIRHRSRLGVAGFLVVHAILHALFASHPHYEFHSVLSSLLIYGAGVCGMGYFLLAVRHPE